MCVCLPFCWYGRTALTARLLSWHSQQQQKQNKNWLETHTDTHVVLCVLILWVESGWKRKEERHFESLMATGSGSANKRSSNWPNQCCCVWFGVCLSSEAKTLVTLTHGNDSVRNRFTAGNCSPSAFASNLTYCLSGSEQTHTHTHTQRTHTDRSYSLEYHTNK